MRLVGDHAHGRGHTVLAPCLPGHGTTIADANRQRWQDWVAHVERALADLKERCPRVFAAGLSLGSLLALHLAAHHPELAGAIAYSPAIKMADPRTRVVALLKYLTPQLPKAEMYAVDPEAESRLWSYDAWPSAAAHEVIKLTRQVKRALPQVRCPALILYSTADPDLHPDAAQFTYDRIGAADKELIALHNCGHLITVDAEWERVAEETCRFIADHT
jgi:carboxylesterase